MPYIDVYVIYIYILVIATVPLSNLPSRHVGINTLPLSTLTIGKILATSSPFLHGHFDRLFPHLGPKPYLLPPSHPTLLPACVVPISLKV